MPGQHRIRRLGREPNRAVEQLQLVRESVAIVPGDGEDDIDPVASQFVAIHELQVVDHTLLIPDRTHAEQGHGHALHRPLVPFRFAVPQHQRHPLRRTSMGLLVALQKLIGHLLADTPRGLGRNPC